MDTKKIEDSIMKNAFSVFSHSAAEFFDIGSNIIAPANTELKDINISTRYTDYTFYTDDGNYLHFEFQTTYNKRDLERFMFYDASLSFRDSKKVKTIVIYSADIDKTDNYLDAGSIKYNIEPFYMNSLDGDIKFQELKNKITEGENLTDNDILTLSFIPLMKSKKSRVERAVESINLSTKIKNSENKSYCLSTLYALLDKFGDDEIKENIWEVITMTELGKLIIEKGMEKGVEKGKKEGKSEMLLKQLTKRFGTLSLAYKEKILNLSNEAIDIISIDIFEMESLKDLDKYLK